MSVVSIKGTDCRIIELGQVANQTGGEVCMSTYILQVTVLLESFMITLCR